ncbi:MAG: hypothetical protein ACOVOQ_01335 [Flavobacterium sp.]
MKENRFESQSKSQLSKRYKVSLPTFNTWLDMIPDLNLIKNKRILTPKQVEKVFNHLGEPPD